MKQTKEQLIIEVTKLRDSHAGWVSGDEVRRKEFAKAFHWYKKRGTYDYIDELLIPSWSEIFVEIGKLLARQKQLAYVSDVEELKLQTRETALLVEELRQRKV